MTANQNARMTFVLSLTILVVVFSAMWPRPVRAECEVTCLIDFELACPDAPGGVCGATFIGSGGCDFAGLGLCYSSGFFSFLINDANPLTIELSDDLIELEVFFANVGLASGEMRFFNSRGEVVGDTLFTNGNCLLIMPPLQSQVFKDGVRTIEVTATGGVVYIDDFTSTLQQAPGGPPDFDADCDVGAFDLAQLLGTWGPCAEPCEPGDPGGTCPADLDGNCDVGAFDLALLLGSWGPT